MRPVVGALLIAATLPFATPTFAQGPTGGVVTGGQGTITRPNDATTRIDQQTQLLALDWQQFNVAQGHTVQFNQPNAQATALNRIHDQNPSQIFGAVIANGNVFLVNPNGIVFGETASVNVNSLFATTLDISPEDFMSGNWNFKQVEGADGMIVNRGLIAAANRGSVTLVAGAVTNEGVILADYGQVTLAGATRTYVDFDGDGLLRFEVSGELQNNPGADSAVANHGTIQANGGQVLLTAQAVDAIFASAVNNGGIITANRVENVGGVVRLGGGANDTVVNNGTIDVSSPDGQGGRVEITGDRVGLMDDSVIDASGVTGGGQVYVGGGFQGNDPEIRNATVTYVADTATVNADATDNGDGGEVIVWADDTTRFFGTISARGGDNGGDGGFVEVSGKRHLQYAGLTDTRAPMGETGTLLLDPDNLTINDAEADVEIDGTDPFSPSAETGSILTWTTILDALDSADVNVQAGGDITVAESPDQLGNSGAYNHANDLSLDAGGSIHVNAEVSNQGTGGLTLDAGANVNLAADITLAGGNLTINAPTVVGASIALASGGGDISFNGALNSGGSARDLTLDAGTTGDILFAGTVGNTLRLGHLQITEANHVTLADGQTMAVQQFTQSAGSGDTTFGGAVTVANPDLFAGGHMVVTTDGAIEFKAPLSTAGMNGAGSGSAGFSVAGDVSLNAGTTVTLAAVTADGGSPGCGCSGGAAGSITVTAPAIVLNGAISARGGVRNGAGGSDGNGGAVALDGAVTLGTDVTIDTRRGGTTGGSELDGEVSITGAVDSHSSGGPYGLTVNAGEAAVVFGGAIGAAEPLAALTINTTGAISLGGSVTTVGTQAYGGPVTLDAAGIILTTTNSAIAFTSTVTGGGAGFGLDADAGSALISLGNNVTLTDAALSLTAVELQGPVTLSTGTGEIIVGAVTASGAGQNLAIANSGGATFESVNLGDGNFGTDLVTGGTVTVTGSFASGSISTGAAAYALAFQGGGSVTGGTATTFLNTGGLSIGASFAFEAGLIYTGGPPMTIGGASPGTVVISAGAGNAITLGSVTIEDGYTLQLGGSTAVVNTISTGTITGGTASNLTILTAGAHTQTTAITVAGGNVTVVAGLNLVVSGNITTSGGDITLENLAGGTYVGVDVNGATLDARGGAGTGAITITGIGGDASDDHAGVRIRGGAQLLTSGGNIALDGSNIAGFGTTRNYGVHIIGNGTVVRAVDGDIQIIGAGGGTSNGHGVVVGSSALVETTGTGTVGLSGTGGTGTVSNYGIQITGSAVIRAVDGNIEIAGTGGGGSMGGHIGVNIWGGTVQATGDGDITISGTSNAASQNSSPGVYLEAGSTSISTAAGSITIMGVGGNDSPGVDIGGAHIVSGTGGISISGTATAGQHGVRIFSSSQVRSTTGAIVIAGTGGTGAAGIWISGGSNLIGGAAMGGDITLRTSNSNGAGDSIQLADVSIRTTGDLFLEPLNAADSIGIGTGAGLFNLSNAELALIHADVATVTIGRADGAHAITVTGATLANDTVIRAPAASATSTITVNGAGISTGGNDITLIAGRNIVVAGDITTTGGDVTLTANFGAITSGDFVGIDVQAAINAGAGHITLHGNGGDAAVNSQVGVRLGTAASRIETTTGNITITGNGGLTGAAHHFGVHLSHVDALVTTESGAITITGTGGGTGVSTHNNRGIFVQQGAITSTGAGAVGAITLVGTGGADNGAGIASGVWVAAGTNVTAVDADIAITGTSTQAGAAHHGIGINGTVQTTTGVVTLNGTSAGGGSAAVHGTGVIGAQSLGVTAAGRVSLTGANAVDAFGAVVTVAGPGVVFNNTQSFEVQGIVTDGGDVTLTTTAGAITQGAGPGNAITGAALSATAVSGIALDNPANAVSSLTATTTGAGAPISFVNSAALLLSGATTDGGDVSVTAANGDLALAVGAVNTGSGAVGVVLEATSGSIVAAAPGIHITSEGAVAFVAAGDVGADGSPIEVSGTGTFSFVGVDGDTYIESDTAPNAVIGSDTGTVEINFGGAALTIVGNGNGTVTIQAGGTTTEDFSVTSTAGIDIIIAVNGITNTGGGTLTIDSDGNITGDGVGAHLISDGLISLNANGDITITIQLSGAGAVEADATGSVTVTSVGGIGIVVGGAGIAAGNGVTIIARSPLVVNSDIDGGTGPVLLVAAGGQPGDDITIDANVFTDDNTITLYAGDNIILLSGSIYTTTSGAVSLFAATDHDGVAVQGAGNPGGSITNPGAVVITAAGTSAITLFADGGIGTGVDPVRTDSTNVEIESQAGGVFIVHAGDVSANVAAALDIALNVGGALTVEAGDSVATTGGDIYVTAADFVLDGNLNAGAGAVTITAAGDGDAAVGSGATGLVLDAGELTRITTSQLTVVTTGTGEITIGTGSALGANYALVLNAQGTGNIIVNANPFQYGGSISVVTPNQFRLEGVVSLLRAGGAISIDAADGVHNAATTGRIRTVNQTITFEPGTHLTLGGGTSLEIDTTDARFESGAAIAINGVTGNGATLHLWSGAGDTSVNGAIVGLGTLDIQYTSAFSTPTGTTTFAGHVEATNVTTHAQPYSIVFAAGATIASGVAFLNTGDLTLSGGATYEFAGNVSHGTGTTYLDGVVDSSGNDIAFGTLNLLASSTLNAGAGAVALGGVEITGVSRNLEIVNSGGVTVGDIDLGGGTLNLTAVTGGIVTINGALTANAITTAANAYNIALNGGGTLSGATTFLNTGTLTIGAPGFTFTGGVTATAPTLQITGDVSTINTAMTLGAVHLTTPIVLSSGSGEIVVGAVTATGNQNLSVSNSGNATFASIDLNAGALTVNSTGTTTFGSTVDAASVTTNAGGTTRLGGNVTTSGAQTYNDNVVLTANVTLTTNGGDVTFVGTIDSDGTARDLSIGLQAASTLSFQDDVGGTSPLRRLTINDSGGGTSLTAIHGDITTTEFQSYDVSVELRGPAGVRTLTASHVAIARVDAAVAGDQGLTISGDARLIRTIGGTGALSSFEVGGTAEFWGTPFGDVIGITADTANFAAIVGQDGTEQLTLNADATVTGTVTNLAAFTVDGTLALNGGTVATAGNQSYTGIVTLGAATTFTSTTGNIDFDSAIAGAGFALTVDAQGATGTVDFGDDVVADQLTVSADQLNLAANVGLDTSAGDGDISLFIDGLALAGANTINAGAGTFQLTPRTTTHSIEFGSVDTATVTDVFYGSSFAGVTAGQFVVGNAAHTGNIVLSAITAPYALTVQNSGAGAIIVEGAFAGTGASALTLISGTSVTLGANITTVGGAIAITGELLVDGTRSLDTTNGAPLTAGASITVTGTTDGANVGGNDRLTVVTGTTGTATFTGVIGGGATTLERLAVVGAAAFLPDLTVGEFSRGPGNTSVTTLNGTTYESTAGEFSLLGTVTLSGNTSVTGAGNVLFQVVNGATHDLTATAAVDVSIQDAITVANLNVTAGGLIWLQGDVTTATGVQDYDGAVDLMGTRTLEGTTVIFRSTINANNAASSLAITGNAQFHGAVGTPSALSSVSVSGTTAINGGAVTTTGTQTYTGAVTLGAGTTLTTTDSAVTFSDTVAGAGHALTIDAGTGAIELAGAVGGAGALGAVALNSTGVTTLGATLSAASLTTDAGGTTHLGGDVTTTGNQTYNDAVVLDATVILAGDTVTFAETVNPDGHGLQGLSVAGNAVFATHVGTSTALALASLEVSGTTSFSGDIFTTGTQTYGGDVTVAGAAGHTLAGNTIIFNGTVDAIAAGRSLTLGGDIEFHAPVGANQPLSSLTASGSGAVLIGADVTTIGTQNYGLRDVTLANGDRALTSTLGVGSIMLETLDGGGGGLTVTGHFELRGVASNLAFLAVSGQSHIWDDITTIGAQSYGGAVTLQGAAGVRTLTGDTVTFSATVNANNAGVQGLAVQGHAVFDSTVGATGALASLSVSGTSAVGGDVTTSGAQAYTGQVTLSGADRTLTATTVTMTGGLVGDGFSLAVSDDFVLGADATGLNALTVGGLSTLGGDVTSSGAQTYTGQVTLAGADRALDATTVTMTGGLVGGGFSLDISNDFVLGAAATGLNALSVGGTSALGANVSSSGNQTYTGAVTLSGGPRTLTSAGGTVAFVSTLDGGNDVLTITGNLALTGNAFDLTTLSVSGDSNLGANVTTTGTQTYNGAVTLTGAGFHRTLTGSTVTFGSTVNSSGDGGTSSDGNGLWITGQAVFNGAVGNDADGALGLLLVSQTAALNGGAIVVLGDVTLQGAVTLGADTTIDAGGFITFGNTVDRDGTARSLTLTAGNNIGLNGIIGGGINGPLGAFTVIAAPQLSVNTTAINVASFDSAASVVLMSDTTITAPGGISFGSTVDSAPTTNHTLVLTAGTGTVTIVGATGGTQPLGGFNVTSAAAVSLASVTVDGTATGEGIIIGAPGSPVATIDVVGDLETQGPTGGALILAGGGISITGDITLGETNIALYGDGDDVIISTGVLVITDFSVHASRDIIISASVQSTGGSIELTAGLGGDGGVLVTSTGSLNAAGDLSVTGTSFTNEGGNGGNATHVGNAITLLGDAVAGGTATFTSTAGNDIVLGADVDSGGLQTYNGPVVLTAPVTLTASTVHFTGTLAGGTNALTITGDLDLDGAATGLATLSVSGASNLGADVSSTGNQSYGGLVTLSGGDRTLTSTGGAVNFGDGLAGGSAALTVDGDLTLVGAASALTALSVTGTSNLGGNVTTSGVQTYTGQVTLSGADRTLTATTVTMSGGLVGGGFSFAVSNDFVLGADATGLNALTVGGLSTLGGDVSSTGAQTYTGLVTLAGADRTLTATTVTMTGGLVGDGFSLDVSNDFVLGAAATGLDALTVGGTAQLAGNVTTSGDQSYAGAVTLTGPRTLTSGGDLLFGGAVTGADLTVANAINVAFGDTLTLTGAFVQTDGAGTTTFAGNLTATQVDILTDAVVLGAGVAFDTSGANGDITIIVDDLTFGGGAQLDAGTGTVLLAPRTLTNTLEICDGVTHGCANTQDSTFNLGNVTVNAGSFTIGRTAHTGDILVSELSPSFGLTVVNGGTGGITVGGPFDGASFIHLTSGSGGIALNADVDAATTHTYNGAVTVSGAPRTLTGTTVTFNGAVSGTALTVDGAAVINGGSVNTTGAQVYLGTVAIGAATTLTATTTTFNDAVSGVSLTVNGAVAINGGSVNTTGAQVYHNAVTLGAATVVTASATTFNGAVSGNALTVNGPVAINGSTVNTAGFNQQYNGMVTLGAATTVTAATATFNGGITGGGNALTVDGNLALNNVAATGLASLTANAISHIGADITTTGAQDFNGTVLLTANVVLTAGGDITFADTVNGGFALATTAAATRFDAAVGSGTALASIAVTGPAFIDGGVVTTTGTQAWNGAVTLGVGTTFNGSAITFGGAVTGPSLVVNGATTLGGNVTTATTQTYNGPVTLSGTRTLIATTVRFNGTVSGAGNDLSIPNALELNGSIAGLGAITVGGATTLFTDASVTGSGTLSFAAIDGARTLSLSGGAVVLNGAVGGGTPLTSLAVTGPATLVDGNVTATGTVSFGSAVTANGALTVNAAVAAFASSVTSSGAQTFNAGTTQTNGVHTSNGGNITLGGQLELQSATTLDAGAGTIALLGVSGGTTLELVSSGGAVFNGQMTVDALGTSGLTGGVTLGGDTTITTAGTVIDLSAASGIDGAHALTLNAGTSRAILPTVGATTALGALTINSSGADELRGDVNAASVTTDTGGTTLIFGNVTTSGEQTYNDVVIVAGAAGTRTLTGSAITFAATVDAASAGTQGLAVTGPAVFAAAVGGSAPLASLSVSGTSSIADGVTTTGSQTYGGAATIDGDFTGSALAFNGAVVIGADSVVLMTSDTLDFNGGAGSVSGTGALTLVPATEGASIGIGGSGAVLNLSAGAFDGFNGALTIGTLGDEGPIVGGPVTVNQQMTLGGSSTLTLMANGSITLEGGGLSAGTLIIAAAGQGSSILNNGGAANVLRADAAMLIAANQVGAVGFDLEIASLSGASAVFEVQIGIGVGQANIAPSTTATTRAGSLAPASQALAQKLGIDVALDATVTSGAQASASREQSGGLAESGQVDASLFEDISLYAIERGVRLPRDQMEDEEDAEYYGPAEDEFDCDAVIAQALAESGGLAIIGGKCAENP